MITLEPLQYEDLPFFSVVRNDCREFLHNNTEFSLEETQKWMSELPEGQKYYLIRKAIDGTPVGYFRTALLIYGDLQVGADLHRDYRRQGYAAAAYLEYFKMNPGKRFYLEVLATNLPAYCLYRKIGFTVYATGEIMREGRPLPVLKMVYYPE